MAFRCYVHVFQSIAEGGWLLVVDVAAAEVAQAAFQFPEACAGLLPSVLCTGAVLHWRALVVGVSVVWQATTVARGAGSGQQRRWTFVILCCGEPAAILIY